LEKQVTALKLKIGVDSAYIETTPTPKRWCAGLIFPWESPEMKPRLIATSAYMCDYPLGVMSRLQFMDALIL
jgi:hypothetical protein